MPERFYGSMSAIIILILAAGLIACSFIFPGSAAQRLIFIEDSLWGLSWLVIARASFLGRKAGFPPKAMAITLGVEIYLMVHYTVIHPWPYQPWLLLNYVLWPLTSLFNLTTVALFSRNEIVPEGNVRKFALRMVLETFAYFVVFGVVARTLPQHLVMAYLGQTVIFAISLHFLFRVLRQDDLIGQGLAGNLIRISAGALCYYVNRVFRGPELSPHLYLQILMPLTVAVDLGFLFVFFRKLRGKN